MHVEHGASVIVSDGRKALFLRNEGDADFPDLRLIDKWEAPVGPDRELKSDAPGRVFGSHGGASRRSSYDEVDFHEQAEMHFAEAIAEYLNGRMREARMAKLILIAPPRVLGILRKQLRDDVADLVVAEIPKDLVKHPIASIEALVADYRGGA